MLRFSKKDLSILIGNSFDHFNNSLYSFIAPILAPLFFPHHDSLMQLILSYSILATSLFSRPIGSYIFSVLAQNKGPVYSLSYSLIGLAINSVLLGLIPSHQQIGFMAPLCLLLTKLIGGIFAAGESAVAKLYIIEGKDSANAHKASYTYQASSMAGIILASLAATLALKCGGNAWRLCYISGALTGFVGYYLRLNNPEEVTQITIKALSGFDSNFKTLWREKVILLKIGLVTGLSYITYSVPFVIMNSYVPLVTDISKIQMMNYNSVFLVIDLLLIPLIGKLTNKFNYRNVMLYSSITIAISIIPLWQNIDNSSLLYITFVRFIVVILGVIFVCPMNLWFKKLRKSSDQYLVISMGQALGSATIGKLSPAICLSLWHYGGYSIYIALYISIIALSAAWAVSEGPQN